MHNGPALRAGVNLPGHCMVSGQVGAPLGVQKLASASPSCAPGSSPAATLPPAAGAARARTQPKPCLHPAICLQPPCSTRCSSRPSCSPPGLHPASCGVLSAVLLSAVVATRCTPVMLRAGEAERAQVGPSCCLRAARRRRHARACRPLHSSAYVRAELGPNCGRSREIDRSRSIPAERAPDQHPGGGNCVVWGRSMGGVCEINGGAAVCSG